MYPILLNSNLAFKSILLAITAYHGINYSRYIDCFLSVLAQKEYWVFNGIRFLYCPKFGPRTHKNDSVWHPIFNTNKCVPWSVSIYKWFGSNFFLFHFNDCTISRCDFYKLKYDVIMGEKILRFQTIKLVQTCTRRILPNALGKSRTTVRLRVTQISLRGPFFNFIYDVWFLLKDNWHNSLYLWAKLTTIKWALTL